MLEINVNENSKITTIQDKFPLGNRDTILVHVKDKLLNERLNVVGTGTCDYVNNYYTYGNFDDQSDLNNIILDLGTDSVVNIVSGVSNNISNCLHLYCSKDNQDFGIVKLVPNKQSYLSSGEYMISYYINVPCGTCSVLYVLNGTTIKTTTYTYEDSIHSTDSTDGWIKTVDTISVDSIGNFYITFQFESGIETNVYFDSLMLFNKTDEKEEPEYSVNCEIDIINPCNIYNTIDRVISWTKNEDDTVDILLYFPEITNVDFQDNLLCKLKFFMYLPEKIVSLGNTIYNKEILEIYNSSPFILTGYILPDINDFDLTANLVVGEI